MFFISIQWGLGGPEEDHQLHHCCWAGRVGEQREEEDFNLISKICCEARLSLFTTVYSIMEILVQVSSHF